MEKFVLDFTLRFFFNQVLSPVETYCRSCWSAVELQTLRLSFSLLSVKLTFFSLDLLTILFHFSSFAFSLHFTCLATVYL